MSVFGDGRISTHADVMHGPWACLRHPGYRGVSGPIRQIFGLWGAKSPKMEDSLPRTLMYYRAEFDAAVFMLAGEIRNRTNTHKKKQHKQTNKQTKNSKRCIRTLPISGVRNCGLAVRPPAVSHAPVRPPPHSAVSHALAKLVDGCKI